ncbi:inositol phosphosphingolipid phospholipase [Sporobolomyces koalae]|uniref:inositol phosphosphingolipid phospholipase n=1 Tax=Sporobolomyces koalae TaxID=500713 RepID=UPI00317DB18F
MAESIEPRLKVLSLNCWGLWIVANRRQERIHAIADWIAASASPTSSSSRTSYHSASSTGSTQDVDGYDVIALQEIWVRQDFELVAERAKRAGLLHSKFFYSGAIGSGLAILSRHPIESSFITPYALNGFPLHFIQGDFFAGKSVCGVTINVPQIGLVDVLNTHMYAPGGEADGVEGAHRVAQAWQMARIVRDRVERGRHVIATGDFNSQPHSIVMRILASCGQLADAFAETHPPPPSITSAHHRSLSPLETLHTHGITCDSPLNTYSAPKLKHKSPSDDIILRGGKRLDYFLYRSPSESTSCLRAVSTSLRLTEPIPTLKISYSDHFALETEFVLSRNTRPLDRDSSQTDLLSQALSTLNRAYRLNLTRSRTHLKLFFVAIVLVPILAVASSFEPLKWLNWIFVLLAIATGAGGSTMLYVGFVAGKWEEGALRNVIGEIEDEIERIRTRERTRGTIE